MKNLEKMKRLPVFKTRDFFCKNIPFVYINTKQN